MQAGRLIVSKLLAAAIGAELGLFLAWWVGPGPTLPIWNRGILSGRLVNTEMVLYPFVGGLLGVVFVGGRAGWMGWGSLTGALAGVFIGLRLPPVTRLPLLSHDVGAIAGALVGMLAGVGLEWRRASIPRPQRAWQLRLLVGIGLAALLWWVTMAARD